MPFITEEKMFPRIWGAPKAEEYDIIRKWKIECQKCGKEEIRKCEKTDGNKNINTKIAKGNS